MLLLPNAARTIFWTTYTSSFVHRDEEIAPIAPAPCRCRMSSMRRATVPIASSQETSCQGSVILSRTIGFNIRSGWVAYPNANRPFTHE